MLKSSRLIVSKSRVWAVAVSLLASGLIAVVSSPVAVAVPAAKDLYVAAGGNLNSGALPINSAATESVTVTLTNADTATKFTVTNAAGNDTSDTSVAIAAITLKAVESGTTQAVETSTQVITLVFDGIDTSTAYAGYSFDSGTTWSSMATGSDSSSVVLANEPKFKFGATSITIWTKRMGIFVIHRVWPGGMTISAPAEPNLQYLADTSTITLETEQFNGVEGVIEYSSTTPSTCTIGSSSGVLTGVETITPLSTCSINAIRKADSVYAAATASTWIFKFSKVSANVLKTSPIVAQIPVNVFTVGVNDFVDSATITMAANSLETDTRFTLTPLQRRSSLLPSFSLTAVDSATGLTPVTQFLKPVRIDLPSSDTTSALPAFKPAGSSTWTAISPGDSATVAAIAAAGDTATATAYEVTSTGFVIWTTHMTSFGVQDEQAALAIESSPSSLTVGAGDATLSPSSTSSGSGFGAMSYTSHTTAVCTVSGATLHPVAAGSCRVTGTRAGDSAYLAKTSDTLTVTVAAATTPPPSGGTGGAVPPIVSTGSASITGTATYDAGGTVKCEAPTYSQTPLSVKFSWGGLVTGTVTLTAEPWSASITIPAKTDGTLICEILATGFGSTASLQASRKIDKPAPVATPIPEPTPTVVARTKYKIKCVKWNKQVKGANIRYKTENNPKCFAGYKQTAKTAIRG